MKIYSRIAKAAVGTLAAVLMLGTMATPAAAITQAEANAIIAALGLTGTQATAIQALVSGNQQTTGTGFQFTALMKKGSKGTQVMELQKALNANLGLSLSTDGIFGNGTHAAVVAFQKANGLGSDGVVGSMTRAKLNSLGGGTVVVPTTGQISVAPAADNPASATLTAGTAFNPVLKFNLSNGSSAPVSVTSLKVTKYGNLGNTLITGVSVFDGNGMRHGNVVTTLGADGVATLGLSADPIVVGAGQTMPITVKVNLDSSAAVSFGMKIANASDIMLASGSVSGAFPLMGNQMWTEQSSSLGAVSVDLMPLNISGTTVNADGVSSYEITKFSIGETSSNENVNIKSLTLWNNGNAADSDLKDILLVDQSGATVATASMVNKYVKFNFTTPFTLLKGQTKNFTVRASVINGASRNVQFVIYDNFDLEVVGATTGTSILASASGSVDTSFPVGDVTSTYNKSTIGSGSVIFSRATDSPSTAVVPGANDVVLAKYNVKPVGENVELRGISFGLDQNTSAIALTGTAFVRVNGSVVFSSAINTTTFPVAGTASARSLSSYPILTAGVDNTIEVSASISSSATTADAYWVNDFDITSVKRLITNDITDPTVAVQDGFTRSVQAAAMTVTTLTTPVATSVVPGTNAHHFASFEFNAQASGEDIRVSSVTVTDTLGAGTDYSDVANLVMKDSAGNIISTTASTSTNAATVAFNFSTPITVTRTSPVTIHLYGDVLSSTTTHTFNIASAANVTSSGLTTGNSFTETVSGSGQLMTIAAGGTLTLSNVAGVGYTPSTAQNVSINQADGIYLAGRFTSQYEAQKITSLTLEAAGTALTGNNIKNIRLYAQNGTGPLLGTTTPFQTIAQFGTCAANVCSYTFTSNDNVLPMAINPGTPVTLFVKADIQGENTAKLGNDFYFRVQNGADVVAKGAVTQTTTTESGNFNDSATAKSYISPFGVTIAGEYPTSGSSSVGGLSAGTQIGRFKIMNNGSAEVTISTVKLSDNGSHVATDWTYSLYVSDQASSNYTGTLVDNDGTDNTANVIDYGSLDTTFTISGGSYRYVTAVLLAGTVASGDSVQLGVSALGDITYSVTEANLGYDGEQDGDITGTITGLYVDGKPSLGTLQKS